MSAEVNTPQLGNRLSPSDLWLLVVLFLVPLIGYIHRLILNILIDPVSQELVLTDTQASFLQGPPFALAYGLMVIPMGLLVDHRKRLVLIGVGALVWSTGTLFCGVASDSSELFLARVIVGVGEAALTPAAVSLVGDAFEGHRRGLAMGVFFTGVNAGFSSAYAVGGLTLEFAEAGYFAALPWIGELAPWRQVFCVISLPGFLIPLLMLTLREPVSEAPKLVSEPRGIRMLFRQPDFFWVFILLIAIASLLAVADNGIYAWLPRLLSRLYTLQPSEIGVSLGIVVAIGGLIGGPVGGKLSDYFSRQLGTAGPLLVVLLGTLLALVSVPLFVSDVLALVYVGTGFWVVAIVATTTSVFTFVAVAAPPQLRGASSSIVTAAMALIGLGLGPTTIAVALEQFNFARERVDLAILVSVLPLCLVVVTLAFIVLRLHRRSTSLVPTSAREQYTDNNVSIER